MSSNPVRLQLLFKKYIQNECTVNELQEFWKLMAELSENDVVSDEVRNYWNTIRSSEEAEQVNWNKAYDKVLSRVAQQEKQLNLTPLYRRKWMYAASAAASLLVVVSLIFLLYSKKKEVPERLVANTEKTAVTHQVINLPDGTAVTLNAGSRLEYPPKFSAKIREVNLIGEAFFDVAHDPERPFLIHTGNIETQVLGTSFNIRAYPEEQELSVVVVTGSVQVIKNKQVLGVLSKNDQIVVNKISNNVQQNKIDASKIVEWKKEDLMFDDVTWDRAAIMIANRFGITIKFDNDALRNCHFSGSFQSDDDLAHVLNVICALTNSQWTQSTEKIVFIKGSGCPDR